MGFEKVVYETKYGSFDEVPLESILSVTVYRTDRLHSRGGNICVETRGVHLLPDDAGFQVSFVRHFGTICQPACDSGQHGVERKVDQVGGIFNNDMWHLACEMVC